MLSAKLNYIMLCYVVCAVLCCAVLCLRCAALRYVTLLYRSLCYFMLCLQAEKISVSAIQQYLSVIYSLMAGMKFFMTLGPDFERKKHSELYLSSQTKTSFIIKISSPQCWCMGTALCFLARLLRGGATVVTLGAQLL